jgi:hypothetical protein
MLAMTSSWVDLLGVGLGDDRADRGGDQLRVPSGTRRRACRVSGCEAGRQSGWPGWEDGAGGNRWHPPDYFCQPIISGVATKNRPAP